MSPKSINQAATAMFCIAVAAATASHGQPVSPLEVILDGRAAAQTTILNEAGIAATSSTFANVVMYACGFLAILLGAMSIYTIYRGVQDADPRQHRNGMVGIAVAGLLSIPAIVAAFVPELLFG